MLSLPDEEYYYPRCESFAFSLGCKIPDLAFSLKCCNLAINFGLDIVSTARIIAFVIDLYQKGILTEADTDGMRLEYGNKEVAFSLIEKIARREGFGNILADGTYEAARIIGRGAEKYTNLVKKQDISQDYFIIRPSNALTLATNDRLDSHAMIAYAVSPSEWGKERSAYIKEGFWFYPKEYEKYLDVDYSVDYEGIAELASYAESIKALTDLTGLCWWWTGFLNSTVIKIDTIVGLIASATGMDIDESEAMNIARRTRSLIRASNVRLGLRRSDDRAPEILFQQEPTARQQQLGFMKLDHDKFGRQLDNYYGLKGWSSDGIPTKENLGELGLDYVRDDLERRGIL